MVDVAGIEPLLQGVLSPMFPSDVAMPGLTNSSGHGLPMKSAVTSLLLRTSLVKNRGGLAA